ncbi:hypothetical protein CBS101457_004751 [Exobasidium rhododendri]|nr:hypothetical protein CBS101457_004751 [Exobasidium rhododendri]
MSAPVFRTDVNIRGPASQTLLDRPSNARGQSSSEYLNEAAESVNKQIDNDVKTLLEAFESLIGLSRIRDKDKYRIAQENLELEARSDVMVRAAQSLTLLSHSLKLSLLLSQEPIDCPDQGDLSLDEEALHLMKSTAAEKERCACLLEDLLGVGGRGEDDVGGDSEAGSDVIRGSEEDTKKSEGIDLDVEGKIPKKEEKGTSAEEDGEEKDIVMDTVE